MIAPIILFVYNRPEHTRKTVEALSANKLANESALFIYSDAAKNDGAKEQVDAVRSYIRTVSGFKSVTIVEREKNWGLASSIIDGVTNIVNQYGKIIVLEDDIVTSPYFLIYMNNALDYYKDNEKVWHISAWIPQIRSKGLPDAFMWHTMNCWGWGTWADSWKYYEKNTDKLIDEFTNDDIRRFNINGTMDLWEQVLSNKRAEINTWAVYWYAVIFRHNGLCLSPTQSYVKNVGLDASGVHCGFSLIYYHDKALCEKIVDFTKIEAREDKEVLKRIMKFYKKQKTILFRVKNKIYKLILKHGMMS
jgi:hypothetical protein